MHQALEHNFGVKIGFGGEGRENLHLVLYGAQPAFKSLLDFIDDIADGKVTAPPKTPVKVHRHNLARDKLFCCYYCAKYYRNTSTEHCTLAHPTEDLVKEILSHEIGSAKRRELCRVSFYIYHNYSCDMIHIYLC